MLHGLKNRIVSGLVVSLLAAAGWLAVTAPAVAGQSAQVNVAAMKVLYPYGCPTGTGNSGAFCLYGDFAYGHINTYYPSSVPRNTCFNYSGADAVPPHNGLPGLPATWTYAVVNTSGVSWRVFRTRTCGGSSLTVPGHSSLSLPDGWYHVVDFAIERTSTIS